MPKTTRRHFFYQPSRAKRIGLLVIVAVLGSFFVYLLSEWSERKALLEAKEKAESVLTYQSSNLALQLNKFSLITALVSKRTDVIDLFRQRNNNASNVPTAIPNSRQLASIITGLSGAKDFWFVGKQGDVFSSSNHLMIGTNVKIEPYFEAAIQGRLGRMSDVDSVGIRSYIFASPVFVDKKVGGMVIVRVNLDVVEYVWALLSEPILATDSNGRVLLSNIVAWRLNTFDTLIQKRYKTAGKMPRKLSEPTEILTSLTTIESVDSPLENYSPRQIRLRQPIIENTSNRYIEVTKYLPLLQWNLHVLVDLSPVRKQKITTMIISSLMVVLCILSLWIMVERRRRLIELARSQQAFALRLERQVRDRTRELTESNNLLASEVTERRSAEMALRETQDDLLQAAKLAGIGQMSAALAHEYNQPLAAIRSYADNAKQLLQLEKPNDVIDNLARITSLTERMASLTKTLRSFAHKSDDTLAPVNLASVMDEMIILLSPQAKKQGVELLVLAPKLNVQVMAGHLRLSQVVINLVTNAMDAIQHEHVQRVEVSWNILGDTVEVWVKDSGKGISDSVKDKIFTPFFTTKGVGVGLGLGLFIVHTMVKEFQGTIDVKQEKNYGGVFCITLPLAK
ncbi:MAG: two-component system C4-dicarboxylate transport sensor histidine kinase DctB [Candidatus Endobugula sp.]|jgi:two-component system C4-dicarboxylate transport sensor histidine kinase DctB